MGKEENDGPSLTRKFRALVIFCRMLLSLGLLDVSSSWIWVLQCNLEGISKCDAINHYIIPSSAQI